MPNPYEKVLRDHMASGTDVVVERQGASGVKGKVGEVGDKVCVIKKPSKQATPKPANIETTIALKDIRGVSSVEWDLDEP